MTTQMMTGAASIAGLLLLAGAGGMSLAACLSPRRLAPFEKAVLTLVWGPLFLAVLALALADAGRFNLRFLALGTGAWAAAGLLALGWTSRMRRPPPPPAETESGQGLFLAGLALLLAAAGFLCTPAHAYLFGGWDPGEYVGTAANVARTGALEIRDPFLPSLTPRERRTLMHQPNPPRRTLQAGFLVTDSEAGRLMPDYYHLYPAWLAVWVGLFGLGGAWAGHTAIALFALGMVVAAAASLFGKRTALAAGALLALCPAQLYLMRFTTAEMLTQFCLFSGFWALARAWREPASAGLTLTAGAAFGTAILAHGTSVLPVAGVLLAALMRARLSGRTCAWGAFLVIAAAAALAMAWNMQRADVVTRFLWQHVTSHPAWWLPAAGLGAAAVLGGPFLAGRFTGRLAGRGWDRVWRWTPLALALVLAALGYAVRPHLGTGPERLNAVYFAALFGPAGALLAIAFFGLRRWSAWSDSQRAFLVAGLVTAGVLLVNKMVQPVFLWAARRWVPIVFPFAAILAAATVAALAKRAGERLDGRVAPDAASPFWKRRLAQGAALLLAAALLGAWHAGMRPRTALLAGSREYDGLPAFLEEVRSAVGEADVVLCWHPEAATPLRYLYNIPSYTLSHLPGPRGVRSAKTATALMRRWVAEGKRVCWIGDPFFDPALSVVEIARPAAAFTILERRTDRLPRTLIPETRAYRICRVGPPSAPPAAAPLTLDLGYSAMGLAGGFSELKRDLAGKTRTGYRQTAGKGRLYIPALAGVWTVRLKGADPKEKELAVGLRAEGRELALLRVTREWADYPFTVPPGLGTNGVMLLEIVSLSADGARTRSGVGVDKLAFPGN
jgi:hypothetical protein